jgi:hypothetical protein
VKCANCGKEIVVPVGKRAFHKEHGSILCNPYVMDESPKAVTSIVATPEAHQGPDESV